MYAFFVSVGPGESRWALYYTLSTLSRMGRIYVHFDSWEEYQRHKETVDQYAETVVLAKKRRGLAQGRSWAVEELPDLEPNAEYICTADSHIVLLQDFDCGGAAACDPQRCDYPPERDADPLSVAAGCVKHYGQAHWNFRYTAFIFNCDHKPFSYNPLICVRRDASVVLRDLYGKYGLPVIPWEEYGADQQQIYVSVFRLYGLGETKCVPGNPVYLHRANRTDHPFWASRWTPERLAKYAVARACFLKLHYPKELWGLVGNEPERCPIPDDVTKKINDEFRYGYAEFLMWFSKYVGQQDVELFRREVEVLGLRL
jgi:hypothetical protein